MPRRPGLYWRFARTHLRLDGEAGFVPLSGFVHTMPGSAAPCKTITTDDCDIRIDHSRIDILTTRTLGRLGDPSKKKGLCVNT